MKKVLALLMAAAMILSLAACGNKNPDSNDDSNDDSNEQENRSDPGDQCRLRPLRIHVSR